MDTKKRPLQPQLSTDSTPYTVKLRDELAIHAPPMPEFFEVNFEQPRPVKLYFEEYVEQDGVVKMGYTAPEKQVAYLKYDAQIEYEQEMYDHSLHIFRLAAWPWHYAGLAMSLREAIPQPPSLGLKRDENDTTH
jgi:hypothetical protein